MKKAATIMVIRWDGQPAIHASERIIIRQTARSFSAIVLLETSGARAAARKPLAGQKTKTNIQGANDMGGGFLTSFALAILKCQTDRCFDHWRPLPWKTNDLRRHRETGGPWDSFN